MDNDQSSLFFNKSSAHISLEKRAREREREKSKIGSYFVNMCLILGIQQSQAKHKRGKWDTPHSIIRFHSHYLFLHSNGLQKHYGSTSFSFPPSSSCWVCDLRFGPRQSRVCGPASRVSHLSALRWR